MVCFSKIKKKKKHLCIHVADENRDLNNHSDSQQIKRERSQVHYNGDASLYSNVSVSVTKRDFMGDLTLLYFDLI